MTNSTILNTHAMDIVGTNRNGTQLTSSSNGDCGMLLLDASLTPVAFDPGVAAILDFPGRSDVNGDLHVYMPDEILSMTRKLRSGTHSSIRTRFRKGNAEYACRLYLLDVQTPGSTQHFFALHFEREFSRADAVQKLSSEYHLTDREEQALRGIALGLSGKQLAERMNISPNTVKVYLRLIMAKMGVTGRGEIAAKLLSAEAEPERKS